MRRRGPLAAVAAGILAMIVAVAVLIAPKVSQIHATNDQLAAARQKQSTLEAQLVQLKATEQRAKAIRTELTLLDAAVPQGADLPDLIRTLTDVADQSDVDFLSIAPGQPIGVSGVSASPTPQASPGTVGASIGALGPSLPEGISLLPFTISINGSYFAVDEYLFRLETLPRISKVTTMNLGLGPGGYPELSLNLTVNFYTTDVSAGPGSQLGTQTSEGLGAPPGTLPSGSPTPPASPAG
jgi:Tfp pilus assembly protein PilO